MASPPSPARVARRFVAAVLRPTGLALHVVKSGSRTSIILYDPVEAYNAIVDEVNKNYEEFERQLDSMKPEHREIYSGVSLSIPPVEDLIAAHVYAFLYSTDKCDGASVVRAVRARSRYGPLIYDIAMSELGPIMPHRNDVSPAARKIWRYYYKNRADVGKRPAESCTEQRQDHLNQIYTLKKPVALGRPKGASRTFVRDTEKLLQEFNVGKQYVLDHEYVPQGRTVTQLLADAGTEFYRRWERLQQRR